jgi:hypothetical protein
MNILTFARYFLAAAGMNHLHGLPERQDEMYHHKYGSL